MIIYLCVFHPTQANPPASRRIPRSSDFLRHDLLPKQANHFSRIDPRPGRNRGASADLARGGLSRSCILPHARSRPFFGGGHNAWVESCSIRLAVETTNRLPVSQRSSQRILATAFLRPHST